MANELGYQFMRSWRYWQCATA